MDAAAISARLADARKFLDAADLYFDEEDIASGNVAGSNAVNSGIAASDVLCGVVLDECSRSGNHYDAIALLWEATQPDPAPRKHLRALLSEKSDYRTARAVSDSRWRSTLLFGRIGFY
jgi:hypothetical protein